MERNNLIIKMYNEGKSMQDIGNSFKDKNHPFGISKQRVWQILKLNYSSIYNHHKKRPDKTIHNSVSELYIIGKLVKLGYKVIPQAYNHPFDLLVNNKKIEVKHSKKSRNTEHNSNNYYFTFSNLTPAQPIDYFIFLCGILGKEKSFIVPANKVNDTFNISLTPKTAPQELKYERYLDNWYVLK